MSSIQLKGFKMKKYMAKTPWVSSSPPFLNIDRPRSAHCIADSCLILFSDLSSSISACQRDLFQKRFFIRLKSSLSLSTALWSAQFNYLGYRKQWLMRRHSSHHFLIWWWCQIWVLVQFLSLSRLASYIFRAFSRCYPVRLVSSGQGI